MEDKNAEPPLDDYGIDHDRILEICESIVHKLHKKFVIENNDIEKPSDFALISTALLNVWNLTQSILDLDDLIRTAIDEISEEEESNDKNENVDDDEGEDDSDDDE